MPFSHHSHSGQFCPGHAKDSLEQVVLTAISKKMQVLAMTEHMPRHDIDRYPEEIDGNVTYASMLENEAAYFAEAVRLRERYASKITLLVGFESDWCGKHSQALIEQSLQKHPFDFFMGSIHHVRGVPVDYSQELYDKAKALVGGSDESLFEEYLDEQLEMLQALQPVVVGHFDLIRLLSGDQNVSFKSMRGVWQRVLRNLDFIASYGGILEINTAALRKGLNEPYPSSEICQAFVARNGRFCLSDDSHGVDHVATNYQRLMPFLRSSSITELCYLTYDVDATSLDDQRNPKLVAKTVSVDKLADHELLQPV